MQSLANHHDETVYSSGMVCTLSLIQILVWIQIGIRL